VLRRGGSAGHLRDRATSHRSLPSEEAHGLKGREQHESTMYG
jgi:hypothetical protein